MRTATVACSLLLLFSAGCVSTTPTLPPPRVAELSAMIYPAEGKWGDDLDIVAVRRGPELRLVNRTPRTYDGVTLWFNQQYVHPMQQIVIGTDNVIDLRQSVDRHGRCYPVGSFLKPDQSLLLVQVELIDPTTNLRHRLTVQPQPREY
ncbi:MAG: hypothetical protein IT445_06520 [Phycisphaeraceae bacterium]|nr:hypothetical protein [Phycisphaeraceae bacterium]